VPYLKSDLFSQLGKLILVFPFIGWLLAVAAVWLFAGEYVRCHPLAYRCQKILENHDYVFDKLPLDSWKVILQRRVG
jgi:hypothetical protein